LNITPRENGLDFSRNEIPVKDVSEVMNAIGNLHNFYTKYDEDEALKLYGIIKEGKEKVAANKAAIKLAKKDQKSKSTPKKQKK
jgi:hypothetical protein